MQGCLYYYNIALSLQHNVNMLIQTRIQNFITDVVCINDWSGKFKILTQANFAAILLTSNLIGITLTVCM